ncbi:unnamed protein product [Paramecium octaurelia]|uniref:C2H2-type domain-containing protein n=1 Tax=Paramecium octaurelia TaxID=43137 RepID=A0A8S1V548_PAROT|nr:unnamed protein product [Paramecium octaurelia]
MEKQNSNEENHEKLDINQLRQAVLDISRRMVSQYKGLLNKIEFIPNIKIQSEQKEVQNSQNFQNVLMMQRTSMKKRKEKKIKNIILEDENGKRYVCRICGKILKNSSKLGGHLRHYHKKNE